MYKTIRHGENSLQYTILPQNDDIRMDGKLTNASSNNFNNKKLNNDYRNKRGSGKNKSFYAYLGLLFVCTVIIGAILIPFFINCIPNPSEWFLKTKVSLIGHNSDSNINNKTNKISKNLSNSTNPTLPTTVAIFSDNMNIKINNSNKYTDSTVYNNGKIIELELHNDKPTTIISTNDTDGKKVFNNLIVNKKLNNHNDAYKIKNDFTISNQIDNTNNNDLLNDENNNNNNNNKNIIDQNTKYVLISRENSISTEQNDKQQQKQSQGHLISKNKFDEIVNSTNNPFEIVVTTAVSYSELNTDRTTETPKVNININRRKLLPLPPIQITKKPIILPILAKTNTKETDLLIPSEHKETKTWIKSHWPFIDPSTYFQWTGYKSEDSVLLPAILGITLIAIILILTLCLVARNKRTIVASVRKRNRNDIDEIGEDNATLLTAANLSDADDE